MYAPPLSRKILSAGTSSGVKIPQGGFVDAGTLDLVLMDQEGQYVTPSSIMYDVLAVDSVGIEHSIGLDALQPLYPRTGRHSPNFLVGDDWAVGTYRLKWKYSLSEGAAPVVRDVDFEVVSSGLYDSRWVGLGLFNIKATVTVV